MIRHCIAAALLAVAPIAADGQETAPAGPPAAIQQAAQAFGTCVRTGIQGVAATVTPEAGATSVLAGCASHRQQLEQAVEAMVANMPEDQRAGVQEQLRTRMAGAEAQVAAAIRRHRAAPAPQPAQ